MCSLVFCTAGRQFVVVDNCGMAKCAVARDYGWCGKCYANMRGRANYAGHFLYRDPARKKVLECASMKIPKKSSLKSSPSVPANLESVYLADFKEIQAFLCSVSSEGSLVRRPGSLTICVEGGRFKARLKDSEEGLFCFLSGDGLDELLDAVEAGLGSGNLEWREDKPFSNGRK